MGQGIETWAHQRKTKPKGRQCCAHLFSFKNFLGLNLGLKYFYTPSTLQVFIHFFVKDKTIFEFLLVLSNNLGSESLRVENI